MHCDAKERFTFGGSTYLQHGRDTCFHQAFVGIRIKVQAECLADDVDEPALSVIVVGHELNRAVPQTIGA